MALLAALRALRSRILVVASVIDLSRLPPCLRTHGGFDFFFPLPPPTAHQRLALVRSMLDSVAAASFTAADSAVASARVEAGQAGASASGHSASGEPPSCVSPEQHEAERRSYLAAVDEIVASRTAGFTVRDLRRMVLLAAAYSVAVADGDVARVSTEALGRAVAEVSPSARGEFWLPVPQGASSRFGGYSQLRARLER